MNSSITFALKGIFKLVLSVILFLKTSEVNADWIHLGNPGTSRISAMIQKNNHIFAGTGGAGIFRSSDNGISWVQVNSGLSSLSINSFTHNSTGVFVSGSGGVRLSTNNGDLWTQAGSGSISGWVVSLTSNGDDIYAGHILAGVFRTTNNGANWTRFALGEGDLMNTILNTGAYFYISIVNTVFRSSNSGKTWISATNGLANNNVEMLSFFGDDLYAGTDAGVFYSADNGGLWTFVSNSLTDTIVTSLTNIGNTVFAGILQQGIFMSNNNGQQWTNVNQGLTDFNITYMLASGKYLFAGADDGSIWRRDISELITNVQLQQTGIAGSFMLQQNFPNPFNPSTKIEFNIPVSGEVTLKVYDNTGRLTDILLNSRLSAGSYSLNFNAAHLPGGIYFYELKSGDYTKTRKMIVLK